MSTKIETRCIHLENDQDHPYGAISYPIFQTATYAHPGVGQSTGFDYSRHKNPTRDHLEKIVASLENGTEAFAYSSGMSAIATVMELFVPGDHLIVEEDLYGGSIRLFDHVNKKNGISFSNVDVANEDVELYFQENTKAIFIETPTNPMMHIVDIEKMAEIAHAHSALLIVDNTFLSPYLQNPLDFGADIVIHSGTKYLSGHNDTLSGFVIVKDEELAEKIGFISKTTGPMISPFDAWLVTRGIQTLSVRMRVAQENAWTIANWLLEQDVIENVFYPGLETHPGHDLMKKQARGFGAMLSFHVKTQKIAHGILENIQLIQYAESLGGTESLLTYPLTQTHADVSKELRDKNGVTETLLRMSVGLENVEDIILDLKQAIEKAKEN
ncbi:MAG: PLP-dependent aspartate aminotransferase family protein [Bacillota bacterium]|nr:PLP-dependent aspartate aminotransferase family protein [Bacillota bacterium]